MSLGSDYEDAVRSGNSQLANYLAKALAANAGININSNNISAAPASMFTQYSSNSSPTASLSIPQGFLDPGQGDADRPKYGLEGVIESLKIIGRAPGQAVDAVTGTAGAVADGAAGVGSLLKIVTDLPRMVTIFIGLILLIAGLFMLGNKTVVAIADHVTA